MAKMICPHCGMEPKALVDYHLIPEHSLENRKCPGSGKVPRNAGTDRNQRNRGNYCEEKSEPRSPSSSEVPLEIVRSAD